MTRLLAIVVSCIITSLAFQSCNSWTHTLTDINNRFSHGEKSGLWTDVDSLGTLRVISFCDGRKDSVVLEVDSSQFNRPSMVDADNAINRTRKGLKEGLWVETTPWVASDTATVLTIGIYSKGLKDGPYVVIFYPDNEMKQKGQYRKGRLNGQITRYFGNGNAWAICKYRNGKEVDSLRPSLKRL